MKRETLRNLLFQIVTTEIIRHLQYMYTVCSTTSSLSLSPPTCCNPPERTIWYIPVQTPLPLPSPGGTFPTESHNPRPILFKKCRQEHKTTQRAKEEQNANEHRTKCQRELSNIPIREKRTLFHTMYLLGGRGNSRTPTTPTPTKRTALESTKNSPNVAFYQ